MNKKIVIKYETSKDVYSTMFKNVSGIFRDCLVDHLTTSSYGRMKQTCKAFYVGLFNEQKENSIRQVSPATRPILKAFVNDASSIDRENIQRIIHMSIYGLALSGTYPVNITQDQYEKITLIRFLRKYSDADKDDYIRNLSDSSRNRLLDAIAQLRAFYEDFSNQEISHIIDIVTRKDSPLGVIKTLFLDHIPLNKKTN